MKNQDKCLLCGSTKDSDSNHLRTSSLNRKGLLEFGYYKPQLSIDEKHIIKSHIGHGEFQICTDRKRCRQTQIESK